MDSGNYISLMALIFLWTNGVILRFSILVTWGRCCPEQQDSKCRTCSKKQTWRRLLKRCHDTDKLLGCPPALWLARCKEVCLGLLSQLCIDKTICFAIPWSCWTDQHTNLYSIEHSGTWYTNSTEQLIQQQTVTKKLHHIEINTEWSKKTGLFLKVCNAYK